MSLPARNRGKEFALTANVFNLKSTLDRFQSNACVSATSGADDRFTVSLFLFLLITILSLFFEGDIRLENIRVLFSAKNANVQRIDKRAFEKPCEQRIVTAAYGTRKCRGEKREEI